MGLGLVGWLRYRRCLQFFQERTDNLVAECVAGDVAKMIFAGLDAVSLRVGQRADRLTFGIGGGVGCEVFGQCVGNSGGWPLMVTRASQNSRSPRTRLVIAAMVLPHHEI